MDESRRRSKQTIIALIFFLILGGIISGVYFGARSGRPSVTPEPAVNFLPIKISFSKAINVKDFDYDFLAQVYNPNLRYGSGLAEYDLYFFNSAGAVVFNKKGTFFILPGQTRYVVDGPIRLSEHPERVDIKITAVDWQEVNQLGIGWVPILTRNILYNETLQAGVFAKVGGEIFNGSDFDLNRVEVFVVLFNKDNQPLALNRTEIRTFLARTNRGFEVSWFSQFSSRIDRIEAEAYTNIFENSNFLREYGGQEKFKQFYQ